MTEPITPTIEVDEMPETIKYLPFRAYSQDARLQDIVPFYVRRYGQQPEFVVRQYGLVLLGPVPEEGDHDPQMRLSLL